MKIWTIAWKDTLIRFRDRNALILMIAAPLVLSAIIGSAFGSFLNGDDPVPFAAIPVFVVNDDEGPLGADFVAILQGEELAELLAITEMADIAAAREMVQMGEARAAVHIPADFSAYVQIDGALPAVDDPQATIRFYPDPAATLTPNIVRGVIVQVANGFSSASISAGVTVTQLQEAGVSGMAFGRLGELLPAAIDDSLSGDNRRTINIERVAVGAEGYTPDVSPFAYFAPSMGILFLMFSMMDSTRSILDEEREGTLDRLVSTPTSSLEILLGKIGGVFLTGMLQFIVFVIASRFIFNLSWGNSLSGLLLMMLAVVISLTSLGTLIAAFARDASQANIIGSVITLAFAAIGGSFVPAQAFPEWLQWVSLLTITRWGLDGFTDLTINGLGVDAVLLEVGVLTGLGMLFFVFALSQFQRRIQR